MDLELAGKVAVVSGSSYGMGFSISLILAQEGANVVINGRNKTRLAEAANKIKEKTGREVLTVVGDVTAASDCQVLIDRAVDHFGGIDILVTNTSGPPAGKFESFDDQDWQQAVELSFLSHMRLIRAALPHLRSSKAASVLTITSYAVRQPIPNLVLSNSIRAATTALTKSLALELGSEGIRFNSILPGWTSTDRVKELMAKRAIDHQTTIESEIENEARQSALLRMATPEEIARPAVFLVSPAASYITGVSLLVDGGTVKGT